MDGRIGDVGLDVDMVRQMMRMYDEDSGFGEVLDRVMEDALEDFEPIVVCKTPNVYAFGGARIGIDMVINPTTILKCMAAPNERFHGHDLDRDVLKYLIFEMRNPAMLLKGSKENTLVAVTDLIDKEGRPIIASVALDRRMAHHQVNQITSAYGRNDFADYLQRQIDKGNLLAVNVKKANQMLRSAGVQFPMEETLISFDNSIAYSFGNVKSISTEKLGKFLRAQDQTERKSTRALEDVLEDAKRRSKAAQYEGRGQGAQIKDLGI